MPVRGLMSLLSPPVMRNLADLQEIGLLPYRPSPFAGLLSGLAQALQPLAAVREARRQEEEEQRQQRLAELSALARFYPEGQIPQPLWEQVRQVARLPEGVPPPPVAPETELQRRLLGLRVGREEFGLERERRFLPLEEKDWQLTLDLKAHQIRRGEIDIEQARAELQEYLATRPFRLRLYEATANLKDLEVRDAQAALEIGQRPLREVLGITEEQVPPHLRPFLNLPLSTVRQLRSDTGELLAWLMDPLEQPASTVLPAEAVERWKKRGIDLTKIPLRDLKVVAPDILRAPYTLREVMGDQWEQWRQQYPLLEALADMPATPELVLSVHDVITKDQNAKKAVARQLIDDYDRRINEAASKGALAELVAVWIGSRNVLAREIGVPEIDPQTAQRLLSSAAILFQINVLKQTLNIQKLQTDIQRGQVTIAATMERLQLERAKTGAYLQNIQSQMSYRAGQFGLAVAREQRLTTEAIDKAVQQELANLKRLGGALTINTPRGPLQVRWTKPLRREGTGQEMAIGAIGQWEVYMPQRGWVPADNQARVEDAVRQHLWQQKQALFAPPPPPAQQLRQRSRSQPSARPQQSRQIAAPTPSQRRPQLIRE